MKRILTSILTLALFFTAQFAFAQRGPAASPKVTIKQMVGNTEMELVYSRPSLDGRDLATLAPNGKVWRTGANENTKINFDKPVKLGGKELAAGEYSLYTIPGGDEWTIIINKAKSWGTQYDESQDVVRFSAKATTTDKKVETFSIEMTDFNKNTKNEAKIELAWGNVSVKFPIEVTN
ncbi:Protein of unknown function (DUF2911) [Roseivirga pacifica]|uniref:DUF2911 domain-containing protein n=1 Tax=Roseivirga pacifica TaxID=1267423 RepID=A0A1I0Q8T3_9BACT|nr:DUF2911 domain-containing protein [Roseivirga pacifica]RKQ43146.1 Protein of unknown function (DUF2911) [Roseivirga pacifica]SEW23214.1 Protein of unknown function [Roseivirga pacifica]